MANRSCNRQTKNLAAIPFLKERLLDLEEDPIVRHEAAEALGAIGDLSSLELLKNLRTSDKELVVRETCEIAVDRLVWENSEEGKAEKLKTRYALLNTTRKRWRHKVLTVVTVTSNLSTQHHQWRTLKTLRHSRPRY